MTKRAGLLGGTFDPVHLGHLQTANIIKDKLRLDEMYLLPLSTPVHKQAPLASDEQRLHCLQLALQTFPDLKIDTTELERKGKSYTVETLRALRKKNPQLQYYYLLGMDAFNHFSSWKNPQEILQLSNLVVINRPGSEMSMEVGKQYATYFCSADEIKAKPAGGIVTMELPSIAVSSTELRLSLAGDNKLDPVNYVPEPVLEYVEQEKIYLQNENL